MKPKIILCLSLSVVAFNLAALARAVRSWTDAELMDASDVVMVGAAVEVKDLDKTNAVEYFTGKFRGVETTFKVSKVLKGKPISDRIVLHHYRFANDGEPPNAPDFVSFTSNSTNEYLLYLVKDGPGRFAPVSGQIDPSSSVKAPPKNPIWSGFPVLPSITDADPSVRHPVSVRFPTRLDIQRTDDSLAIRFASFQSTNLTVGSNMVTGIMCENKIYRSGEVPPSGGIGLQGGLDMESHLDSYNYVFTRSRDKIPQPGEQYVVEYRLTIFETDIPAQHMWSPQSSKHYRVLRTQTFGETVK